MSTRQCQIPQGLIPGQGRLGSRNMILWDQPFDRIHDPRDTGIYGSGLRLLWVAGDGDTPTVGPALTAIGAPVAEVAPYQLEGGADVALEGYDGATYRRSLVPIDPGAGEDTVVVAIGRMPLYQAAPGYQRIISTLVPGTLNGAMLCLNNTNTQLLWRVQGAGGAAGVGAAGIAPGGLYVAIGLYDRSADAIVLWCDGAVSAPSALPDGALAGGGIALGADVDGVMPIGPGAGLACAAYLIGTGIAAQWAADSYARCAELAQRLTGVRPSHGGAPTYARASAACRRDRHGRWWIYSDGVPRAGDSEDFRVEATRTNKCYRNVGVPLGALPEWEVYDETGGAVVLNAGKSVQGAEDAAALAAAGLRDVGPNVWDRTAVGGAECIVMGASTGAVTRHALSVFADIVTAAGDIEIGWVDTVALTWTSVGSIAGAYARSVFCDLVPPSVASRFAIRLLADGDHVRGVLQQLEGSGDASRCVATTPIPNWATAAAAVRGADILDTTITPRDDQGSVEIEATPSWTGALYEGGAGLTLISRSVAGSYLLYVGGAGVWRSWDGTLEVSAPTGPQSGVRQLIRIRWGAAGQRLDVDGARGSAPYDGTLMSAGVLRLAASGAGVGVRRLRFYRNGSG